MKLIQIKFLLGKGSQRGQALFEFFAFLPFMMIMYSITLTIANAINGSINQQKITRGYFYNLIHNDANLPTVEILQDFRSHSVRSVGMFAIGWSFRPENENQIAPCYKLMSLSKTTRNEECTPGNSEGDTTQFIRVKTAYGICSASYYLDSFGYQFSSNKPGTIPAAAYNSCLNI